MSEKEDHLDFEKFIQSLWREPFRLFALQMKRLMRIVHQLFWKWFLFGRIVFGEFLQRSLGIEEKSACLSLSLSFVEIPCFLEVKQNFSYRYRSALVKENKKKKEKGLERILIWLHQ
jgi:hypothetical protein